MSRVIRHTRLALSFNRCHYGAAELEVTLCGQAYLCCYLWSWVNSWRLHLPRLSKSRLPSSFRDPCSSATRNAPIPRSRLTARSSAISPQSMACLTFGFAPWVRPTIGRSLPTPSAASAISPGSMTISTSSTPKTWAATKTGGFIRPTSPPGRPRTSRPSRRCASMSWPMTGRLPTRFCFRLISAIPNCSMSIVSI